MRCLPFASSLGYRISDCFSGYNPKKNLSAVYSNTDKQAMAYIEAVNATLVELVTGNNPSYGVWPVWDPNRLAAPLPDRLMEKQRRLFAFVDE